ncbi:amino acid permease [Fervidicoccus fontis]|uniref:amino acid permease n=1 Tax=Fervidicoccus fontis TaxID=683846 RepID=UPI0023550BD2|nr:amino acid permease [Fervidicoccus fontis]
MSSERRLKLLRSLGNLHTFFIGLGAIVGGSIVVLIGPIIYLSGSLGSIIVLLMSAIIATLTALIYSEITSAIPEVGGGFLWAKLTMPRPFPFISGWVNWMAHMMSGTFYALSFSSMFLQFLAEIGFNIPFLPPYIFERLIAIILIIAFAYLNYSGVSKTGRFSIVIGIFFVASILLFSTIGIFSGIKSGELINGLLNSPAKFTSVSSFFIAMISVVIAFEGYEILAQTAEETKAPTKNLPRAIMETLIVATILYISVTISTIGILGTKAYSLSTIWGPDTVIRTASLAFRYGGIIVAAGGLATVLSSINSTMYSASRVLLAMSRAGEFPIVFSEIHKKYRTPSNSILFTMAVMIIMSLILDLTLSAFIAGVLFNVLFIIVNYTSIKLREFYGEKLKYKFLTPYYPLIPLTGLIIKVFLFFAALIIYPSATLFALLLIVIGYLIYRSYLFKYEVEHEFVTLESQGSLVRSDFRIMVLLPPEIRTNLIRLASDIAKAKNGEINLLKIIKTPYQLSVKDYRNEAVKKDVRSLKDIIDHLNETGIHARYSIKAARSKTEAIIASIDEERIDLLIMSAEDAMKLNSVMRLSTCDILIVNTEYPYISYMKSKKIIAILSEDEKYIVDEVKEIFPDREIEEIIIEEEPNTNNISKTLNEVLSKESDITIILMSFNIWEKLTKYNLTMKKLIFPYFVFKRGSFSIDVLRQIFFERRKEE